MSVNSGAGAYVQSAGTGERSPLLTTSVIGEVVLRLVRARLLLAQLHQDVVDEARRPDAVEVGRQPLRAERLVHLHQVLDRVLRGADAARGLHADAATGLLVDVEDSLEHDELQGQRRSSGKLAVRRLNKVAARRHREQG